MDFVSGFEHHCLEFENATRNIRSNEEIERCNQQLLKYHRIDKGYNIGFMALSQLLKPCVHYQSIILCESSLMREWETFTSDDICQLIIRLYEIFTYLSGNIETFKILKRFCPLVGKVLRRGHYNCFNTFMDLLVQTTNQLISSDSYTNLESAYFILLYSIISEYSEIRFSFAYISLDDIIEVRKEFENNYLLTLFQIFITAIVKRIFVDSRLQSVELQYIKNLINCLEVTLFWHHGLDKYNFKNAWFRESITDFEPSENWVETIVKCDLCSLLFFLFEKFNTETALNGLISSCLIRYSTINVNVNNFPNFLKNHFETYFQKIFSLLSKLSVNLTPNTVWCICCCLRKIQDSPFKKKNESFHFNITVLKYLFSKENFLLPFLQKLAILLTSDDSDIYMDSVDELVFYFHSVREQLFKNSIHYNNPSAKIFFENISSFGKFIIENELIQPVGVLQSTPCHYDFQNELDLIKSNKYEGSWVNSCGCTFIPNFSQYLGEKMVQIISDMHSKFLTINANSSVDLSNIFYNTTRIINFFTKSLIDETSYHFMYLGILSISTSPTSRRETRDFIRCYVNWFHKGDFSKPPLFLSNIPPLINGHVLFLISIMIVWQYIIELIKVSGIRDELLILLHSVLNFIKYFNVFFKNVELLPYRGGVPTSSTIERCVKFITTTDDKCDITQIILKNAYNLFKISTDCLIINDMCFKILKSVSETIHKNSLFDGQRTSELCKMYLEDFIIMIKTSIPSDFFAKNFTGLIVIGSCYCRIPDACVKIFQSLSDLILEKFAFDCTRYSKAYSSLDPLDQISLWLLNFSLLHGSLTSFFVPIQSERKYPILLSNIFDQIHQSFVVTAIKFNSDPKILVSYISVMNKYFKLFTYFPIDDIDLISHMQMIENLSSSYCPTFKSRLPCSDLQKETAIFNEYLKVFIAFARFTVTAIHVSEAIIATGSLKFRNELNEKFCYLIKNILFSLLINSNNDFLTVPKISIKLFNALSEFIHQYKSLLKNFDQNDIVILLNYVALGLKSKCDLLLSVNCLIEESTPGSIAISPIIEAVISMICQSITFDDLDYFCKTFLYILKYYHHVVFNTLLIFLKEKECNQTLMETVSSIVTSLFNLATQEGQIDNEKTFQSIHHFLRLLSILRN